jgi:hypothetical protein
MSVERRLFVRLPHAAAATVAALQQRSEAALARAAKAPLGDRVDVTRFEQAQTEIELIAVVTANGERPVAVIEESPAGEGRRSCIVNRNSFPDDVSDSTAQQLRRWLEQDAVVVECVLPFALGATIAQKGAGWPTPVADVWDSPTGKRGKAAVFERFETELAACVRPDPTKLSAIIPSGVSNEVLTEGLRRFAARRPGAGATEAVTAAVSYRDGSTARAFPLRCLELVDDREPMGTILSFSLLSIRHVALDAIVDGAWLRNREVSRPRPAGDTDEFAYRESVTQLDRLCAAGPTTIVMYQTGLDTAIVGFYRAVAERLAASDGADLLVLPMYFRGEKPYEPGRAWRVR